MEKARDAVKPFPPETFRLIFAGVKGSLVEAGDALSGAPLELQAKSTGAGSLEVTLPLTDKPVLITIQACLRIQ